MAIGRVKWFSNQRGYGFIITEEDPDEDIFVHHSAIKEEGYRTLARDQEVEFKLISGDKGKQAIDVVKI